MLSDDTLTIDERPFASNNSDVHKGRYKNLRVCVKKLRVTPASDLEKANKGDTARYYCHYASVSDGPHSCCSEKL